MTRKKAQTEQPDTKTDFAFISLCTAIAFETLFFWPYFSNAYSVPKVAAVLLGAAILLPQVCILMHRNPTRSPSVRRLILFFSFQLIAISWATVNSLSPHVSFWGGDWRRMGWITQFAMMCTAVAVPVTINGHSRKWRRFLQAVAAIGTIGALYGVFQWAGWDLFLPATVRNQIVAQFGGRYRSPGTIGQSTYFANVLLFPFFASLALLVGANSRRSRLLTAAALLTVGTAIIVAAAARASVLGCAAGIVVFALWAVLYRGRSTITFQKRPWARVAIAAVLLVALVGYTRARLTNLGTDSESIGRVLVWQDVGTRILPNIWMHGSGPGMFRPLFAAYRSPSYGLSGPDVHWETPHNIFLDRLTEQGIPGLLSFSAMIVLFFSNIAFALRSSADWKHSAQYAAIGAGGVAALASSLFNGEVIPTTYYLYLWFGLSSAAHDRTRRAVNRTPPYHPPRSGISQPLPVIVGITLSVGFAWYAQQNWNAETLLEAGKQAARIQDESKLLEAIEKSSSTFPQIGTYQVEFAELVDSFLQDKRNVLDNMTRRRLAQAGIAAALRGVEQSDKPMLALFHLVAFGRLTTDSRTEAWLDRLKQIDPYWFRPHEVSARLLLAQRKIDEALKESTRAYQLAPYTDSTVNLWRQLLMVRSESR